MPHMSLILSTAIVSTYFWFKLSRSRSLNQQQQGLQIQRWAQNFSFEVVNQIISFIMIQTVTFRLCAELLSRQISLSIESVCWTLLAVLCLDFVFYWRHRLYHRFLMGIHKTHHPSGEFELTLSLRIHPVEMLIQMFLFVLAIYIFKLNHWQATLVNTVFAIQSFYSHLELQILSTKLTGWIENLVVVPNFHRKHHELDSNRHFGFLFSFWDRIFTTATQQGEM